MGVHDRPPLPVAGHVAEEPAAQNLGDVVATDRLGHFLDAGEHVLERPQALHARGVVRLHVGCNQ